MGKKMKIAFFVVMALNAILCIVDVATTNYTGAILTGVTVAWLFISYKLTRLIEDAQALIDDYWMEIEKLANKLKESSTREAIATQELAKMRKRAESAEKKLQQMIDDTPARGKDGRFVKREE
ncbi:MAG: hypothetical protein IKA96_02730 [Alistipes sp.]|nr:hypothetical protein [Alistipes sp.]MBR3792782.1 hypothetical protein [Alistipes sp.]